MSAAALFWQDGRLIAGDRLSLPATDRGLLLGDGLFETLLLLDGRLWRKAEHMQRLRDSAAALALPLDDRPQRALDDLAAAAPQGCWALRLTLTRGPGQRGLRLPDAPRPSVFASLSPWRLDAGGPLRLRQSAIRRNESSPLSRLKTLGYLDNVLVLEAAVADGADDALLLNGQGRAACTSAGNIFALIGDALLTPPVEDGVLPGITRQAILQRAGELGLDARPQSLDPAQLRAARLVFAVNSLRLIQPVVSLDGAALAQDAALLQRLDALMRAEIQSSPR